MERQTCGFSIGFDWLGIILDIVSAALKSKWHGTKKGFAEQPYFVQARNSLNLIIHHCIAAPYDPTVSSTPSKDEPLYKVENARGREAVRKSGYGTGKYHTYHTTHLTRSKRREVDKNPFSSLFGR